MLQDDSCLLCTLCMDSEMPKALSPYVRKKQHIISKAELFPFWLPWPSKSITGNRMLQQEAVLTLRLLVPLDGLCLFSDRGGKCC